MNEQITEVKKRRIPKALSVTICGVTRDEARHLVDAYYQTQEHRIALFGQLRAVNQGVDGEGKPNEALEWLADDMQYQENQIKTMLDWYTDRSRVGRWCKATMGIGPVIAAGLVSSFDVVGRNAAATFWSYAGLNDNNKPWLKKNGAEAAIKYFDTHEVNEENIRAFADEYKYDEDVLLTVAKKDGKDKVLPTGKYNTESIRKYIAKPPYNKDLKVLCWKIGQQFLKLCNNEKSLYGKVYKQRKEYEMAKNEAGDYADQAADKIKYTKTWNNKEQHACYLSGKLPASHINNRALRFAVKLFISHLFEAMYYYENGVKAPQPYAIAIKGHKDYIPPEVDFDSIK